VVRRLNQTFVTPIEREDILRLASALDDIVDFAEEVADYLGLYRRPSAASAEYSSFRSAPLSIAAAIIARPRPSPRRRIAWRCLSWLHPDRSSYRRVANATRGSAPNPCL
jgi:hypothetical protein